MLISVAVFCQDPAQLEFKSSAQSSFFVFFGIGPDWITLGSLGTVPWLLKDQSKVAATSLLKTSFFAFY